MAQECKREYFVAKPGTRVFVPIEVAPGESVGDVLAAIGAPGALGLATGAAQPSLVLLRGAVVWLNAQPGARLYIIASCCPC
jgi:hypothetical protein